MVRSPLVANSDDAPGCRDERCGYDPYSLEESGRRQGFESKAHGARHARKIRAVPTTAAYETEGK
jgi:hypothetical protein